MGVVLKNDRAVRILKMGVNKVGEPIFAEGAVTVEIDDFAAGEFVKVKSNTDDPALEGYLCIDKREWPALRQTIDYMIKQCEEPN
jgi:hypothetical protein